MIFGITIKLRGRSYTYKTGTYKAIERFRDRVSVTNERISALEERVTSLEKATRPTDIETIGTLEEPIDLKDIEIYPCSDNR